MNDVFSWYLPIEVPRLQISQSIAATMCVKQPPSSWPKDLPFIVHVGNYHSGSGKGWSMVGRPNLRVTPQASPMCPSDGERIKSCWCDNDLVRAGHAEGRLGAHHLSYYPLAPSASLSYPVFMSKPSTHRMHDPGSNVPHIRPKGSTENQIS
jgi:hypothetical protein